MYDCRVWLDGVEYFVWGVVVQNEYDGLVTCPNCDTIRGVATNIPGLENVSVRKIRKDGDPYRCSIDPSSPQGIKATAMAEENLLAEVEVTHHCTECDYRF